MYFALGFLVAALFLLMLLPALWSRAKRLCMRRLASQLPISMEEVAVDRSLLHAQYAVRELRVEQQMDAVRASKAQVMAHAGRQAACIVDLGSQLENSEKRAAGLESRLNEAGQAAENMACVLSSTRSELDALKLAKHELDEAFEETCARLRVFEHRHQYEADIESVARRRAIAPQTNDSPASSAIADAPSPSGGREAIGPISPAWDEWADEAALDALPPGEAIAYLQSCAGRKDETGSRALTEALGRLPLALEFAAAYCKRTQMSFAAYQRKASTLIAVAPRGSAYPGVVSATFDLAAAEAIKQVPAAETLIAILGCCAPARIPLTFVKGLSEDETESRTALLALTELSLVKHDRFEDGTPAVSAHPIVHALSRARTNAGGGPATAIERSIKRLIEIYPLDGYDNPASGPLCSQLTPHLLAIFETKIADENLGAEHADLMVRAGSYFHGGGAYARAEPLFQTALAIRERTFGPTHPETAASLNNLASLRCAQGDLAGALPLFERALANFEKSFGSAYSQTGRHRANYARLLLMIGRPAEALALAESALTTLEKSSGPNHAWTKGSACVVGDALDALGQTEKAAVLRARYGIMQKDPRNSKLSEIQDAFSALRRHSFMERFGLDLIKRWRLSSRNSIAKSH